MNTSMRFVIVGTLIFVGVIAAVSVVAVYPAKAADATLRVLSVGTCSSAPCYFDAKYDPDGSGSQAELSVSLSATWSVVSGPAVYGGSGNGAALFSGTGSTGVATIKATYQGISATANMNVVIGPASAAAPGCTITSNPNVATGGPVTLFYDVVNLPTSIRITADDTAAAPTGNPTVAGPNVNDVGGGGWGSIMSGPIKKNTVFKMTVSNAKGSNSCTATIFYNPRPASGWQVPLLKQDAFFSRFDIPGGFDTSFGYMPFDTAYWISGGSKGYFVVNGPGNSGAGLGTAAAPLRTKANKFEAGGMYGFKEDGTFVGVRDVVYDSSRRAGGCFEAGGCTANGMLSPIGAGKFVRDLNNAPNRNYGWVRGPILYGVGDSGFAMDQRLFFSERGGGNESEQSDSVGRLESFSHVAVAGGKMIGVAQRYAGYYPVGPSEQGVANGVSRHRIALTTEIYDANFNKLAVFSDSAPARQPGVAYSGVPPTTVPLYYPVVGVGDYIIGSGLRPAGGLGTAFGPFTVYKMPSVDQLTSGSRPASLGTILDGRFLLSYTLDTSNPNRIAFFTIPNGTPIGTAPTMTIFEAGQSGLVKVSERQLSLSGGYISGSLVTAIAVSGDYVAYGYCPGGWTGSAGVFFGGCGLVVEKVADGTKLAVEPLPLSKYSDYGLEGFHAEVGDAQKIGAVAISPTGRILVTTGAGPNSGGGDNGNVYLYQIGGAQSSTNPCVANPALPQCNPGGPTSTNTFPGVTGQSLDVYYSTSSPSTPSVLAKLANVSSIGPASLGIFIFGKSYRVDVSRSQILNSVWAPTTLANFSVGSFANVWGSLDANDPTLIHAITVRNPSITNPALMTSQSSAGVTSAGTSVIGPPSASTATQTQLNILQQALKALLLRVGQ